MTDPAAHRPVNRFSGLTALAGLGAFVLVLVGALALREVADLLVPFLFGLFLALIALPLVRSFERRGASPRAALALTIAVVLLVILVTAVAVALSVAQLAFELPRYESRFRTLVTDVQTLLAGFGIETDANALAAIVSPGAVAGMVRPIVSAVSGIGVTLFVLAFTTIFALADSRSLRERAQIAFGMDGLLLPGVERFGTELRRYLLVRAQLGLFAAVLVLILMVVLGVPFAPLWAFFTFAASFIPNIGSIIALVPPAILAFLDGGPVPALLVVGGYTLINILQDYLLQPRMMGTELNMSPLVVLVSLISWTWVLGAAGALLAVPLSVGLLLILESSPATRGIAALLRARTDLPPEAEGPPEAGSAGEPAGA